MIDDVAKIYCVICPETSEPRYVGQTRLMLRDRLLQHYSKYSTVGSSDWYKNLRGQGKRPTIILLDVVPECELTFWEKWWISYLRSLGANLLNRSKGGESGYSTRGKTPDDPILVPIPKLHEESYRIAAKSCGMSLERWVHELMKNAIGEYVASRRLFVPDSAYKHWDDTAGKYWMSCIPDDDYEEPVELIPYYD